MHVGSFFTQTLAPSELSNGSSASTNFIAYTRYVKIDAAIS